MVIVCDNATERKKMSLEGKKDKRSAVDMANSVGSSITLPDKSWLDLSIFNLAEWQNFLVQSGPWLLNSLELQIADLQKLAVEQATAIDLRQTFGLPQLELALPVFAQLANMEAEARKSLREGALQAEVIINQIRNEIERNLAIFFAAQINQLEDQEQAHLEALAAVEKETSNQENLAEVAKQSKVPLEKKIQELRREKNELVDLLNSFLTGVGNKIRGAFETTVFQASQQSLAITGIT